jgi:ABC-type nitrate/sulfonate/bicarbonate transport system permease component
VPGWLAGIIGTVVLVGAWWALSVTVFTPPPGTTFTPVPSPLAVFTQMADDGVLAYWGVFQVTITEALIGFAWGNAIALLLAATVLLVPRIETVVTQIAVVSYCLPVVAVGGIAIVILGGAKHPGDPSATAIFLAALAVFFTTVVGALLGFKAADPASLDVVRVFGGGRFTQLTKVRLIAASSTRSRSPCRRHFSARCSASTWGRPIAAWESPSSDCRATWTRPGCGPSSCSAPSSHSSATPQSV